MASKNVRRINLETIITSVGAGRSAMKYKRGQPIFRQGDAADAVFCIQDGKVQITVISE
jgi:CRP-like cAMP-binding protein